MRFGLLLFLCRPPARTVEEFPDGRVFHARQLEHRANTLNLAIGENGETEDIEGISSTDKAIFLHGQQDQETWNATISLEDGSLTGGISSTPSSFALFGHCTKK